MIVAAVFTILMQVKTGEVPFEARMNHWLHNSQVSVYLQGTAAGIIHAAKNIYSSAKDVGQKGSTAYKEGAAEQAKK